MPLPHRRRSRKKKRTLAKTNNFTATLESASGVPLEGTPKRFIELVKDELKKELRRKHLRAVIQYLSEGDNSETYAPQYAARKNREARNVRRIGGPKTYSPLGPVDFSFTGSLLNAIKQRVSSDENSVTSTIYAPPGQHRNGLSYTALVDQLDKDKNLRKQALEAVKANKATLIRSTAKKSLARAALRF